MSREPPWKTRLSIWLALSNSPPVECCYQTWSPSPFMNLNIVRLDNGLFLFFSKSVLVFVASVPLVLPMFSPSSLFFLRCPALRKYPFMTALLAFRQDFPPSQIIFTRSREILRYGHVVPRHLALGLPPLWSRNWSRWSLRALGLWHLDLPDSGVSLVLAFLEDWAPAAFLATLQHTIPQETLSSQTFSACP